MSALVANRALHRVVDLPVSLALAADPAGRQRLRDQLDAAGLFEGLSWPDAALVADAVTADAGRTDGVETMRHRARTVAVGRETWDDRASVVWALTVAAGVLEMFGEAGDVM